MKDFFLKLFSSDFMPHGYCYLWRPDIVLLNAASDGLIAVAYFLIPILLIYFVHKRRDLPFTWIFFMFGTFIFGCGSTHVMEIWTLWHGTYRLAGLIKAITAGVSLVTAGTLFPMIPRALALPSPRALRIEIAERKHAEEALQEAKDELEHRVQERTTDLLQANEKLTESEAALRRHQKELESLAGRLITAQEDERKRIARDLHDDLSQRFALHCVQLDLLRMNLPTGSAAVLALAQLRKEADALTLDVRRISHDLHHPQLSLGLQHGVVIFCREFSEQHRIAVSFNHEGDLKVIPETVAVVLFRVLQEAMGNVVKHSGADQVKVFISVTENQVRMRVTDCGRGFRIDEVPNDCGLGLISIRERLRLVGGTMNIASAPGQGTDLIVAVPKRTAEVARAASN